MPKRRPRFELRGEMTPQKVDQLNSMIEELYTLVNIAGSHNLIDDSVHADTREDPESNNLANPVTVARGDLVTGQTTPQGADVIKWQRLEVGPANTVLRSDGDDPQWGSVQLDADVTGVLPVVNGGTGVASLTDHTVLLGNGANDIETVVGVGTSGQVLTSNGAGLDPTWQDAAAGTGTGSGTDHLHGIQRVLGDGATVTFNLLDIAEYLEHIADNGAVVDPNTFTLSADRSQITFDVAPTAGHVLTFEYVIARL